jgi:hypothetical protein
MSVRVWDWMIPAGSCTAIVHEIVWAGLSGQSVDIVQYQSLDGYTRLSHRRDLTHPAKMHLYRS